MTDVERVLRLAEVADTTHPQRSGKRQIDRAGRQFEQIVRTALDKGRTCSR